MAPFCNHSGLFNGIHMFCAYLYAMDVCVLVYRENIISVSTWARVHVWMHKWIITYPLSHQFNACVCVYVSVVQFPAHFRFEYLICTHSKCPEERQRWKWGRKRIKINVSWLVHCFTRILFSWCHMICWIFALTSITAMATDIFFVRQLYYYRLLLLLLRLPKCRECITSM